MESRAISLVCVACLFATFGCRDKKGETQPDMAIDGGGEDVAPDTDMDTGSPGDVADVGSDADADGGIVLPDEGIFIDGLSAPVSVALDQHGIPHIACETDADCFAAQAYYHAQHRFFVMDAFRRVPTARVSTLTGQLGLDIDVASRALYSTREGELLTDALFEKASDETKTFLQAYANGVNAFLRDVRLERNGARLSEEYAFPFFANAEIPDWTPRDSIAVMLVQIEQLSNRATVELETGAAYSELTSEQAFDLLGVMSATTTNTMGVAGETYMPNALLVRPDLSQLDSPREYLRPATNAIDEARGSLTKVRSFLDLFGDAPQASNNWVIGGGLTTTGRPILANDPHLRLSNPTLLHLGHIDSVSSGEGTLHLAGASVPGFPGILFGHNEDLAWGGSDANYDMSDVYIETLNADATAVIFEGREVPIIEIEHTFEVAGGTPTTRTVQFVPHHGPILSIDEEANTAVSLRWIGNDGVDDIDYVFQLMRSSTVGEFRQRATRGGSLDMNWGVMDSSGAIGWYPLNPVPIRPWASLSLPPWIPLPGDGSAEWEGFLSVDDLPQMTDPSTGFIATANQDATGSLLDGDPTNDGHTPLQWAWNGWRHTRIVEMIEAGGTAHDVDTSVAMQGDVEMLLAEGIAPEVIAAADANAGVLSAEASQLVDQMRGWQYTCPTGLDGTDPESPKTTDATAAAESIGCTAFNHLLYQLSSATFADELAETTFDNLADRRLIRTLYVIFTDPARLAEPDAYWDDVTTPEVETREETILAAVEAAAAQVVARLGTEPDDWRWGRIHTASFQAPFFSTVGVSRFDADPLAAPGGPYTVNVATPVAPLQDDYAFRHAVLLRHVSMFGPDGIESKWQLPGGQVHDRDSPLYNSLVDEWVANEPYDMPFTREAVESAAVETVTIEPTPQ